MHNNEESFHTRQEPFYNWYETIHSHFSRRLVLSVEDVLQQ
jgi:hypothetical protein